MDQSSFEWPTKALIKPTKEWIIFLSFTLLMFMKSDWVRFVLSGNGYKLKEGRFWFEKRKKPTTMLSAWQRSRGLGTLWDLCPERFSRHDWMLHDPEVSVWIQRQRCGLEVGLEISPCIFQLQWLWESIGGDSQEDLKPNMCYWKVYKSLLSTCEKHVEIKEAGIFLHDW